MRRRRHLEPGPDTDVVVSNATLQWVPSHRELRHGLGAGPARPAAGWRSRCRATSVRPRTRSCARWPSRRAGRLAGRRPAPRRRRGRARGVRRAAAAAPGSRPTRGRRPTCTCWPAPTRCWSGCAAPACAPCSPRCRRPSVAQFEAEFAALLRDAYPADAGRHAVPVPARLRRRAQVVITGYDHVQVAIPRGGEDVARAFYGRLLGMTEQPKPPALAVRGGCWFSSGPAVLHLGVEEPFAPARKAHPAFWSTTSTRCGTRSRRPGTSASTRRARSRACSASTRSTRSATGWSSSTRDTIEGVTLRNWAGSLDVLDRSAAPPVDGRRAAGAGRRQRRGCGRWAPAHSFSRGRRHDGRRWSACAGLGAADRGRRGRAHGDGRRRHALRRAGRRARGAGLRAAQPRLAAAHLGGRRRARPAPTARATATVPGRGRRRRSSSSRADGDTGAGCAAATPRSAGRCVALGALGVVTRVTLAIEPSYEVRQDVWLDVPLEASPTTSTRSWPPATASACSPTGRARTSSTRCGSRRAPTHAVADGTRWGAPAGRDRRSTRSPARTRRPRPSSSACPGRWHERLPHFRLEFTPEQRRRAADASTSSRASTAPAALRALADARPERRRCRCSSCARSPPTTCGSPVRAGATASALHFTWVNDDARGAAGARRARGGAGAVRPASALGQGLRHRPGRGARAVPAAAPTSAALAAHHDPRAQVRQRVPRDATSTEPRPARASARALISCNPGASRRLHKIVRTGYFLAAGAFFAGVFFAAAFLAVFLAGAFLAALRAAFFAGPRARRSASSSDARSSVIASIVVALAQRRVGLAVGDVRAEAAVLDHHRLARHGSLPSSRSGGAAAARAPALLGLGEDRRGLVEGDREQLLLGCRSSASRCPS